MRDSVFLPSNQKPASNSRPVLIWCCVLVCLIAGSFASSALGQESSLQLGSPIGGGVRQSANIADASLFVGRLETMRHNDNGKTRLALLNDRSQVVAFVAPTARYNMREYLGQEIGVSARSFSQSDAGVPFVVVDSLTAMSPDRANSAWTPQNQTAGTVQQPQSANPIRQASYQEQSRGGSPRGGSPRVEPACHNGSCGPGNVVSDGVVVGDSYAGQAWAVDNGSHGAISGPELGCSECSSGMMTGMPCDSCGPGPSPAPYHGMDCQIPNCSQCRTATICQPTPQTCGPPGWLWLRGEYLLWWAKGMSTPPLVTTGPATNPASAGVLGDGSTADILYGDEDLLSLSNSGYRIRFGGFFGQCKKFGYEGEYYSLSNSEMFYADEGDHDVLARPFFNLNPRSNGSGSLSPPARNDSELVAYPGILAGSIQVDTSSNFDAAAGRLRWNFCCKQRCDNCGGGGGCGCRRCGYSPFCKIDFTAGYRHYGLEERIRIDENLRALGTTTDGDIQIIDDFRTDNSFNGAELGFQWEAGWNRWTFELLSLVAMGNNKQMVDIDGTTIIRPTGGDAVTYDAAGFQAFDGTYERDRFAMIPTLNTNLGFYLTPRLRFIVGYSLVYWGGVLRPGEHIPEQINPDFLQPELDPTVGSIPDFAFDETDYWIQGLNLGLDYRW